jgi:hypothetical protein
MARSNISEFERVRESLAVVGDHKLNFHFGALWQRAYPVGHWVRGQREEQHRLGKEFNMWRNRIAVRSFHNAAERRTSDKRRANDVHLLAASKRAHGGVESAKLDVPPARKHLLVRIGVEGVRDRSWFSNAPVTRREEEEEQSRECSSIKKKNKKERKAYPRTSENARRNSRSLCFVDASDMHKLSKTPLPSLSKRTDLVPPRIL